MAKSSGRFISRAVIRISTEPMIEMASSRSSNMLGTGTISSMMMPMTPSAISTSPRNSQPRMSSAVGRAMPSFISGASAMTERARGQTDRLGDHGVIGRRRRRRGRVIVGGDHHGVARGRDGQADVVGRPVPAGAGLVRYGPPRGYARLNAARAGGRVDHPAKQTIAAVIGERRVVVDEQPLHVGDGL